jgi:hypothetical protein
MNTKVLSLKPWKPGGEETITRTIDQQVEYVAHLLSAIVKMKKPVVPATTKSDEDKQELH